MLWASLALAIISLAGCSSDKCPETEIVGDMNEKHEKALEIVRKRCGQIYKDAPCVKYFEITPMGYKVMCGGKNVN